MSGIRFRQKGSLFLPTGGANKTITFHNHDYYGEDGMVIIVNLETGRTRELTPAKALYVASELHKAFVAKKKTTELLAAIDPADQRAWDLALQQIYTMAKEQEALASKNMDAATSARATRGKFRHLSRKK